MCEYIVIYIEDLGNIWIKLLEVSFSKTNINGGQTNWVLLYNSLGFGLLITLWALDMLVDIGETYFVIAI